MKDAWKRWGRPIIPAELRRWWRFRFGWRWFRGDDATWADARATSTGHDDATVQDRVRDAGRKVKGGQAQWERDGVAFAEPEVNGPLLAGERWWQPDVFGAPE